MIYLYGLTDAPDIAALEGVDGVTGPVETAQLDGAVLIYGPHDGGEIRAKRRYLLAHARVLEMALQAGTVLPMRFGMAAEDVAEVAALIAKQRDRITDHFQRLAGFVELGIRIDFDKPQALEHQLQRHPTLMRERDRLAEAPQVDRMAQAEFGRRLGEALDRHRTDCQQALVRALKPHLNDLVLRAPETEAQLLSADILLPAMEQEAFAAQLDTLVRKTEFLPGAEPHLRFVGPVPAYSFVRFDLGRTPTSEAA